MNMRRRRWVIVIVTVSVVLLLVTRWTPNVPRVIETSDGLAITAIFDDNISLEREVSDRSLEREVPSGPLEREVPDSPLEREVSDSPLEREVPDSPLEREVPDGRILPRQSVSPRSKQISLDTISRRISVYSTSPAISHDQTSRGPLGLQIHPTNCVERKRVAFVKVHKAASTTITSILQRFGYTRNLTFALPRRDVYHIGLYETFHPEIVLPIPTGSVYEIVCQHVLFNKQAFKKYLPPNINVIASVQEPTDKFVSTFMFFPEYSQTVRSKLNSTDPLRLMKEYLKDPELNEPTIFKNGSLALNRMSFVLGIPKSQYRNCSYVTEYIKMLDESMTFVLVAYRFDESLVILKRRMCWSTKDILYNVRHKKTKRPFGIPLDLRTTMQIVSPSDFKIYEYFSKKLKKIAAAEIKLTEEVFHFRKTLSLIGTYCRKGVSSPKLQTLDVAASEFSEAFSFNKTDCISLTMAEKDFVKQLIRTQVPRSKHQLFLGWSN